MRFGAPQTAQDRRTRPRPWFRSHNGDAGSRRGRHRMRVIMDPAVVAGLVGRPVGPALRLDEIRARAIARQLDELRRLVRAATLRGVAA